MITLLKLNLWVFLIQLDVTSAQLLVTDNDFRDPEFRKQLTDTVESLLDLKVVPIFNENDAVSTRRAPYEVYLLLWLRLQSQTSCQGSSLYSSPNLCIINENFF